LESYITELYDRPYPTKSLGFENEEADTDEKYPYILHSEVEKAIKQMRIRTLQEIMM
jgi:hypothetical protein